MIHPVQSAVSALDAVDWPVVRAVTDAAAIGVGGFILRMVWKSYERTVQLHTAVFGDPDDPKPNGIKRDISRLKEDAAAAVSEAAAAVDAVTSYQEENKGWRERFESNMNTNANRVQGMMSRLEEKVDTLAERRKHPR